MRVIPLAPVQDRVGLSSKGRQQQSETIFPPHVFFIPTERGRREKSEAVSGEEAAEEEEKEEEKAGHLRIFQGRQGKKG